MEQSSRQILALCTHTPYLEIAIGNPALYQHQRWELGRELGKYIHTHLEMMMRGRSWASLEAIAIGIGTTETTSYTGMRIGLAIARTLGQQLSLSVYTVSDPDSAITILELVDQEMALGNFPHWNSALPVYRD